MKQNNYKISVRLTMMLFSILAIVFIMLLLMTYFFLPNYYSFQLNKNAKAAMAEVEKSNLETEKIKRIEEKYAVTVVVSNPKDVVIDDFNEGLRLKLNRKGIALNRFWLTQESLDELTTTDHGVTKVFDQGKQKSSFLTKIAFINQQVVVVGTSIAYFSETASIMNRFFFISLGLILLIVMSIIYFMTRQLLRPLTVIKDSAERIADLDYVTIDSYPPNELGDLAKSIDMMSAALKENQEKLSRQNQQITQLTADLTHELKTPIAVIQAYASGIEDGIDDGTYHRVVLKQAELLDTIVSDMLKYSKTSQLDFPLTKIDVLAVIKGKLVTLTPLAEVSGKKLIINSNFDYHGDSIVLLGNAYLLELAFDNIISNAIRYASTGEIHITLEKKEGHLLFEISNDRLTDRQSNFLEASELWQPFVVGVDSRNKELAGTGLGLSIVDNILTQHGFERLISTDNNHFKLSIDFKIVLG